jgi:isocitrate lyase
MRNFNFAAQELQESWENDLRWQGIKRNYQPIDVLELRGCLKFITPRPNNSKSL